MEPLIILLLVIYICLFIVGFTGNFVMILVTIQSKSLRSVCNMLICATCFFDLLLFTDILAFVLSQFVPIKQELCFYLNIPADFGAFASNIAVFVVGIDRLIALAWPVRYKRIELEKGKYVCTILSLPCVYALVLLYLAWIGEHPDKDVICLLPVSLNRTYETFAVTSLFVNLTVPFIYYAIYKKIKGSHMRSSMKSVYRSLTMAVLICVGGWMTTDLIGSLTVAIPMDPYVANMIQLYVGSFIFSASACNVFVYYRYSKDYRRSIRSALCRGSVGTYRDNVSTSRNVPTSRLPEIITSFAT